MFEIVPQIALGFIILPAQWHCSLSFADMKTRQTFVSRCLQVWHYICLDWFLKAYLYYSEVENGLFWVNGHLFNTQLLFVAEAAWTAACWLVIVSQLLPVAAGLSANQTSYCCFSRLCMMPHLRQVVCESVLICMLDIPILYQINCYDDLNEQTSAKEKCFPNSLAYWVALLVSYTQSAPSAKIRH